MAKYPSVPFIRNKQRLCATSSPAPSLVMTLRFPPSNPPTRSFYTRALGLRRVMLVTSLAFNFEAYNCVSKVKHKMFAGS